MPAPARSSLAAHTPPPPLTLHNGQMYTEPSVWALSAKEFAPAMAPAARATPVEAAGAADDVLQRYSLHRALAPLLITAQAFGVLPVCGVGAAEGPAALRFRWRSARTAWALLALAGSLLMAACNALRLARVGLTFLASSPTVFCATQAVAAALLLRLGGAWPGLMRRWAATERALDRRLGPLPRLRRTLRALAATLLLVGAAEHALSTAQNALRWRGRCGASAGGWFAPFARHSYAPLELLAAGGAPWVPYAAAPLALVVLHENFTWCFVDALIAVLSVALAARFRQLHGRLDALRPLRLSQVEWRTLREDYNQLSSLTKDVDAEISKLVLLSFGNNLYFVCLQLLHSMKPSPEEEEQGGTGALYFGWSFGFLLLKTGVVSLCAADVHEASRLPRRLLYDVPPEGYGLEVQRFLTQVVTDDVVLTGLNFFAVTRTLLLTVAGTIVTYEIVLVQFNSLSDGGDRNASSTEDILCNASLLAP